VPELVLSEHRPTARDLLRPVPRPVLRGLAALGVVLALLVAWLVLRPEDDGVEYVHRTPIEFNFHYPPVLKRMAPSDDRFVGLERKRDGLFLDSFAVAPLAVPAHRGDVSGILPVLADREVERLRGRFAQFEWVQEGKTRINEVPGYTISFRARLGERRLYGRVVLLPEPEPGSRRGVTLLVLATPAAGVPTAEEVGLHGPVKTAYRSFRFGTERP
jgi:hypothetical protein